MKIDEKQGVKVQVKMQVKVQLSLWETRMFVR
jgi:hypothetical protein